MPILRVAFDYEDTIELLPDELQFDIEGMQLSKVGRISRNKVFCEFQLEEDRAYRVRVRNTPKNMDYELSVSEFLLDIGRLTEAELSIWKKVIPDIVPK